MSNPLLSLIPMQRANKTGQENTALTTGNSIADLFAQQGNIAASGVVGAQGAKQAGINNLLNIGGRLGAAYLGGGA